MSQGCIVPKCKTGYKSMTKKCSVFKVPKNEVLRKQWEEAIPGITSLTVPQSLCERHFDKNAPYKKKISRIRR